MTRPPTVLLVLLGLTLVLQRPFPPAGAVLSAAEVVETRYYLAAKVGTGTLQDPYRPADADKYPKGSPYLEFGDKAAFLVQVTATPTVQDALKVQAVPLAKGATIDGPTLSAALQAAGVDATWVPASVTADAAIAVLRQEAVVQSMEQGLAGASAILAAAKSGISQ